MSDTPRTDKAAFGIPSMHGDTGFNGPPKVYTAAGFSRELENELAEAIKQRDEAHARHLEFNKKLMRELGDLKASIAQIKRERDEWKKCAEELFLLAYELNDDGFEPGDEDGIDRFNKLKGEK